MSPQSQKTEEEKIYQSECVTTSPALLRVRLARLRVVVLLMHSCVLSCTSVMSDSETLRTQAPTPLVPLSMGFSRQESWSGLPYPPPGDLPNPRITHLLHCRQILYLPSNLGSPIYVQNNTNIRNLVHNQTFILGWFSHLLKIYLTTFWF